MKLPSIHSSRYVLRALSLAAIACVASAAPARAQCHEWSDRFGPRGTSAPVRAQAVFDDGSGLALYVGGDFVSVGSTAANRIARFDGKQWTALGDGLDGRVNALAVFDDGSGNALYAAGTFNTADGVTVNRIARWDGTSWSSLGTGFGGFDVPSSLAVFDDGSGGGPALYVSGAFTSAGGASASCIAKWDGSTWSALGAGLNAGALDLEAFDDGAGAQLYAAGGFTNAGGLTAFRIARWDGSAWSALPGGGSFSTVRTLAVFDDGSGPALYAGGDFSTIGGVSASRIAKWNGIGWSALGSGVTGGFATYSSSVSSLAVHDDGSGGGARLYAGGNFTHAGGVASPGIARWSGSAWSGLGHTMQYTDGVGALPGVLTMVEFADGSGRGPVLCAGGALTLSAGSTLAYHLARWDGAAWDELAVGDGIDGTHVVDLCEWNDSSGGGPTLVATGSFKSAGDAITNRIARWDGSQWEPLGAGWPTVGGSTHPETLIAFDDGLANSPGLYVGGEVPGGLRRWNGVAWSVVGADILYGGPGGSGYAVVSALEVWDDGANGPSLYAGGDFLGFVGNTTSPNVARWDGASWSAVGSGLGATGQTVLCLSAFQPQGGASALYAGGWFDGHLARWDGASWTTVGSGVSGGGFVGVYALCAFDDGSGAGPSLFVCGKFTTAGGVPAANIAKWDGVAFSALGTGLDSEARALAVFDDGGGPALYVGGAFTTAGGVPANRIARWDGTSWSSVGSGMDSSVVALLAFDDGADEFTDLYAGGQFNQAGGRPSQHIAQLFGCEPGVAYCFGDGLDPLVTALCPCGNFGDAGRGCANSNASLGGARLFAIGSTSPNTIAFTCEGVPNNNLSTFLRGSANDPAGSVFGDGVKCASGTLIRFGQQNSGQGGNPPNSVQSPTATVPAGNTRYYQLHYRNPSAGFCPPEAFNVSNGYFVEW